VRPRKSVVWSRAALNMNETGGAGAIHRHLLLAHLQFVDVQRFYHPAPAVIGTSGAHGGGRPSLLLPDQRRSSSQQPSREPSSFAAHINPTCLPSPARDFEISRAPAGPAHPPQRAVGPAGPAR
jgi:hypothetical protein